MAVRVEDLRDQADCGAALAQLRRLMIAIAWFELERRRPQLSDLSAAQTARLVRDASERAGVAVLKQLGDYHGQSRFEIWAAKFAIHETAAATRRHNNAAVCTSMKDPGPGREANALSSPLWAGVLLDNWPRDPRMVDGKPRKQDPLRSAEMT